MMSVHQKCMCSTVTLFPTQWWEKVECLLCPFFKKNRGGGLREGRFAETLVNDTQSTTVQNKVARLYAACWMSQSISQMFTLQKSKSQKSRLLFFDLFCLRLSSFMSSCNTKICVPKQLLVYNHSIKEAFPRVPDFRRSRTHVIMSADWSTAWDRYGDHFRTLIVIFESVSHFQIFFYFYFFLYRSRCQSCFWETRHFTH